MEDDYARQRLTKAVRKLDQAEDDLSVADASGDEAQIAEAKLGVAEAKLGVAKTERGVADASGDEARIAEANAAVNQANVVVSALIRKIHGSCALLGFICVWVWMWTRARVCVAQDLARSGSLGLNLARACLRVSCPSGPLLR